MIMTGTLVPNFQEIEVSTVQEYSSTYSGNDSQREVQDHSQGTFLTTIQVLTSSLTLVGNLLLIRVLYDLPNSKLRKTTKLLLSYVSVSFCMCSIALLGRAFQMPCVGFLAVVMATSINALGGMLWLALETFFMVNRPHTQHKFVSMKTCTIAILLSFLVSLFFDLVAFVTRRKGYSASLCYTNNGMLHPLFVFLLTDFRLLMITVTSVVQWRTVRRLTNVVPIHKQTTYTVSVLSSNMETIPDPFIPKEISTGHVKKSPLHKLTIMLSVTLLCFIISWTPLFICLIVFSLCELLSIEVRLKSQISVGLSSLVMLDGTLHVLIYLVMSTQIRQTVIRYCKMCFCLHRN